MTNLHLLQAATACYALSVFAYLAQIVLQRNWLQRSALLLVSGGFLLQSACLAWRWQLAGFLPVTNLFSTLFFFSWALAACYLYFELRYRIGASGLFVMFLNLLLLSVALRRDAAIPPLVAALDTPFFSLHIVFSFLGYALFAMAFSLGGLYLIQRFLPLRQLPELPLLRKLNEEAIFLGFALFTLCLVIGAVWAYWAWGYYFSWNIKGIWSFLVWLFYAGMCHAKFIRRWQGTGYALLSIAGFGVVLFTYLGIGLLLDSNHPLE
ncbi:MAG: cytochrome c biogenesis protein CcsA [Desulfuromonadales bacterium]|jgi:cytochrome c-type biogenesis protein CcsB|nr:cytochrome c biogenesis protein CcsA [Desulfuromonadales bacterium]